MKTLLTVPINRKLCLRINTKKDYIKKTLKTYKMIKNMITIL